MDRLVVPQGTFALARFPRRGNDSLRAWDAADEFILRGLADPTSIPFGSLRPPTFQAHEHRSRPLIFNDAFGALAVALADLGPVSVTDSHLSRRGAEANMAANGVDATAVDFLSPLDGLPSRMGAVLLKVPKTLSLLEYQLHMLRSVSDPNTQVIAGGMVKHVHSSTLALFEEIIGPTVTSLAKKKARLIISTFDPGLTPATNPWPRLARLSNGMEAVVHAGVFAGTKLDVGTRLMLDNLPDPPGTPDVVDLGCGNGLLGTVFLKSVLLSSREAGPPEATVTFTDESHLAIASAKATFAAHHPNREARFVIGDAGDCLETASADVVVCNPPFHASNALSDAGAWKMFTESRRILRPGGELRVVGNRHLGYHVKLKKLFGNCVTVASTPKFVVLSARQK